jgi:glycosyltransferase involved in cell wall biosynthesis
MARGVDGPLRLLAYTDAPTIGGAEHSLRNLLAALDPAHEISIVGIDEDIVEAIAAVRPEARRVVLPAVRDKRHVGAIAAHVRAVRALRPHVLHANLGTTFSGQYGIFAGLLQPRTRVVIVEHSPIAPTSPLQRRIKRALSKRAAGHVSVGQTAARMTEAAIGLPTGSVQTIYNAVPDIAVEPLPRLAPGPVVGAVGRLSPEKGFDVFVRALTLLPGVTGAIVGDGPERGALERLAGEVGVTDRLHVTGWTDEARRHLPSLDVLAVPSRFEALPLIVPEAMLARLPVVATDVGSIAEAVADGETGLLVPTEDPVRLADALRGLLDDAETRARMGERGRAVALERFAPAATAAAFEDLYRAALRR